MKADGANDGYDVVITSGNDYDSDDGDDDDDDDDGDDGSSSFIVRQTPNSYLWIDDIGRHRLNEISTFQIMRPPTTDLMSSRNLSFVQPDVANCNKERWKHTD